MSAQFFKLFCCLIWIIGVHAGEPTGNLDDEQMELVKYSAPINLSSKSEEKVLSLGLLESVITKLKIIYTHLDITDLNSINNGSIFWKDPYDAIVIYLALEKDPDRDQKLLIMYQALKPGGKGIIVCAPKNCRSIHYWVEQFVENNTEWKPFISNTPNLSLEDYRMLIQNSGFNIIEERTWVSVLCNMDTSRWLCDRWAVPLSMEYRFTGAFYRFLSTIFKYEICFFTGMYYFLIEK